MGPSAIIVQQNVPVINDRQYKFTFECNGSLLSNWTVKMIWTSSSISLLNSTTPIVGTTYIYPSDASQVAQGSAFLQTMDISVPKGAYYCQVLIYSGDTNTQSFSASLNVTNISMGLSYSQTPESDTPSMGIVAWANLLSSNTMTGGIYFSYANANFTDMSSVNVSSGISKLFFDKIPSQLGISGSVALLQRASDVLSPSYQNPSTWPYLSASNGVVITSSSRVFDNISLPYSGSWSLSLFGSGLVNLNVSGSNSNPSLHYDISQIFHPSGTSLEEQELNVSVGEPGWLNLTFSSSSAVTLQWLLMNSLNAINNGNSSTIVGLSMAKNNPSSPISFGIKGDSAVFLVFHQAYTGNWILKGIKNQHFNLIFSNLTRYQPRLLRIHTASD